MQLSPDQLASLQAALGQLNSAPGQMTLGQQAITNAHDLAGRPQAPNAMAGKVVAPISPINVLDQGLEGYLTGRGTRQMQAGLAQQAQGRGQVQQMIANLLRGGAGSGTGGAAPPATAPSVPWDQEQQGT